MWRIYHRDRPAIFRLLQNRPGYTAVLCNIRRKIYLYRHLPSTNRHPLFFSRRYIDRFRHCACGKKIEKQRNNYYKQYADKSCFGISPHISVHTITPLYFTPLFRRIRLSCRIVRKFLFYFNTKRKADKKNTQNKILTSKKVFSFSAICDTIIGNIFKNLR